MSTGFPCEVFDEIWGGGWDSLAWKSLCKKKEGEATKLERYDKSTNTKERIRANGTIEAWRHCLQEEVVEVALRGKVIERTRVCLREEGSRV